MFVTLTREYVNICRALCTCTWTYLDGEWVLFTNTLQSIPKKNLDFLRNENAFSRVIWEDLTNTLTSGMFTSSTTYLYSFESSSISGVRVAERGFGVRNLMSGSFSGLDDDESLTLPLVLWLDSGRRFCCRWAIPDVEPLLGVFLPWMPSGSSEQSREEERDESLTWLIDKRRRGDFNTFEMTGTRTGILGGDEEWRCQPRREN